MPNWSTKGVRCGARRGHCPAAPARSYECHLPGHTPVMAQIQEIRLVDDLDGGDAAETVRFSLDGRHYEIDLGEDNAAALREVLDKFVTAGRRRRGPRTLRVAAASTAAVDREQNQAIRRWASTNGFTVAEKGRLPQHVLDAFHQRA